MSKTLDEQLDDARKVVQEHAAKHPAVEAGCTPEQVAAFEKICEGLDRYVSREDGFELVLKHLVLSDRDSISGLIRYHVRSHPWGQWLAWCQETGRNTEG